MSDREERPWGWFEVLFEEENLKVKRIAVNPGERLSLQSHRSRAENWTVIQGQALVTVGEKSRRLSVHEMVFIPPDTKHRMQNPGNGILLFVEIQTGSYLGEDDIIRHEDDYDRV